MVFTIYTHLLVNCDRIIKKNKTFGYFCLIVEQDLNKSEKRQWLWDLSLSDEKAFEQMFDYFYADLCIYAKRYIPDLQTREDLVQDVFCTIWVNRRKIDYSLPLSKYLVISVKNNCLNYLRKNNRQDSDYERIIETVPLYAENQDELIHIRELEEIFNRVLSELPEEYRIAFVMSRMEDKSSSEIAVRLGVSIRTVERYRNKAIQILQNELKDYLPLLLILLHDRI